MAVSILASKDQFSDVWAGCKGLSSWELPSLLSAAIQRCLQEVNVAEGLQIAAFLAMPAFSPLYLAQTIK